MAKKTIIAGKPTYTSKPSYVAPPPRRTIIAAPPAYVAPKPAYVAPKPAYVAPKPSYTPPPASKPSSPALSPEIIAEIQRKASLGKPLTNSTQQSQALYDQFRQATNPAPAPAAPVAPAASSSGLSQEILQEIQRKASLGKPLTNPTTQAQAIYNQHKPVGTAAPAAPSSTGLSQEILQEIQRKASLGKPLTNPNQQTQSLYDKYRGVTSPASPTAASTAGLSQETILEIQRKASLGKPLTNPTAQTQAIYNQYKSGGGGGSGTTSLSPVDSPYGHSITGFDPNSDVHKQIADLSQQWGQATTKAERDAIAARSLAIGTAAGGVRDPRTGQWTFPAGGGQGETGTVTPEEEVPEEEVPEEREKTIDELINEEIAKIIEAIGIGGGGTGNFMDDPSQWQEVSNDMGQAEYDRMMAQYQQLINSLQGNQNSDLSSLQADVYGNQQQLEDTSFQDWMKARQSMADRGLAGSGIASDQDTRLLLDRGRQMARINQDAIAKAQSVRSQYAGKINEAQATMAGLNLTEMQRKSFQAIFESGNKAMMDKADMFLKYLKQRDDFRLGQGDLQFKYDQLDSQTKQYYDRLSSDEKIAFAKMDNENRQLAVKLSTESKQFYDKLTSDEKIAFAKMDNENQQLVAKLSQEYDIEMTKITTNGQIDMAKLAETIRHNQTSEINDANRIGQMAISDAANLSEKMRQFDARVQMDANKLQNTQWATQGRNIATQISAANTRITNITSQLTKLDPASATYDHDSNVLKNQLKTEYAKQYSLATALDDLTYGRSPGQGGGSTGGTGTTGGLQAYYRQLYGGAFKSGGSGSGTSPN